MADKYETNSVWGADYRRALAAGDTAYADKLRRAMDAQPQAANTAAQIVAQTLTQGRGNGAGVWANGADGQQVNGLGEIRAAQPAVSNITGPGKGGNLYSFSPNPAAAPAASTVIGQAAPTMTAAQFAATQGEHAAPLATGGKPTVPPPKVNAGPRGLTEGTGTVPESPFVRQARAIAQNMTNRNGPRLYQGNFQKPTGLAAPGPNLYSGLRYK